MISRPTGALAHGDQREQSPEAVPINEVKVSSAIAEKETLVCRLNDVFGIHLVPQSGADVPAGQDCKLVDESLEEFLGCGVVLTAQPGLELRKGVGHTSCSSDSASQSATKARN